MLPLENTEQTFTVIAREEGGEQLFFAASKLSCSGVFLHSNLLLSTGKRLLVEFRLPGTKHVIQTWARVSLLGTHPDSDGSGGGMLVRFTELDQKDREAIDHFINPRQEETEDGGGPSEFAMQFAEELGREMAEVANGGGDAAGSDTADSDNDPAEK